jgi:hypothetical protein
MNRLSNGSKDLLHYIVCISGLQPLTQCQAIDHWPVDRYEFIPRRHIRRVAKTHD